MEAREIHSVIPGARRALRSLATQAILRLSDLQGPFKPKPVCGSLLPGSPHSQPGKGRFLEGWMLVTAESDHAAPQEPCSLLPACRTQGLAAQLVLPAHIFAALTQNLFKPQFTCPKLSSPNVCHLISRESTERTFKADQQGPCASWSLSTFHRGRCGQKQVYATNNPAFQRTSVQSKAPDTFPSPFPEPGTAQDLPSTSCPPQDHSRDVINKKSLFSLQPASQKAY